jgi:cell shape-determining protein MreD
MIYYLLMPVFAILLLVFQSTVLDLLTFGKIKLEISLLLVIYAGFHLDIIKGGVLSLVLGAFLDCVTSLIPGFHVLFYVFIFFISKQVSTRVYLEGISFIVIFTFFCVFLEGVVIFFVYLFMFDINISNDIFNTYLPQSLVLCAIGPACFALFYRLDSLMQYGEEK